MQILLTHPLAACDKHNINGVNTMKLTMNVKDSGMISRTGIVGSYAGIIATVIGTSRGNRKK